MKLNTTLLSFSMLVAVSTACDWILSSLSPTKVFGRNESPLQSCAAPVSPTAVPFQNCGLQFMIGL